MPDNKDMRSQQDRNRAAGEQDYELSFLEEKLGASREEVKAAIEAVGNDRNKVEEYLKERKGGNSSREYVDNVR